MPAYRKTVDYLLVAAQICKDIYDDERCTMTISVWEEKCDQRGEKFLEEFEEEVHNAMNGVVAKVKEARDRKNLVDM